MTIPASISRLKVYGAGASATDDVHAPRKALVVGRESRLGAALIAQLTARGDDVVATTRHRGGSDVYLDLADPSSTWRLPTGPTIAYICASVTSIQTCESRPDETASINVTGVIDLCRQLARAGVLPVCFSTNLVFDGGRPQMRTDDPLRPQCAYGRQKAAMERALCLEGLPCRIVRMTKIIDPAQNLFLHWTHQLLRGQLIEAFTDMVMAPITLEHAIAAILNAGESQLPGITHVSATTDISYYQAAQRLAQQLHVQTSLVQPVSATQREPRPVFVPKHTSLASSDPGHPFQPDPLTAVDTFADRHHLAIRNP